MVTLAIAFATIITIGCTLACLFDLGVENGWWRDG